LLAEIEMKRLSLILFLLSICPPCRLAWAHGVVGDYVFLEPLIAQDPTPANEFDIIQPGWVKSSDGRTFSLATSIEKVLAHDSEGLSRFSIGGGTNWSYQSPKDGPNDNGFDDLGVFAKYAFLIVPKHEFLMSIVLNALLPTGNPHIEAQQHSSIGPSLLWEKALGDLPNRPFLKYLRPIGLQGNLGYLPTVGGHTSHQLSANQVIEYSFPYLSNNVEDIGLRPPFRNLFLFTEFGYAQLIAGPPHQTFPNLLLTPGIAYVGYRFEVSVGTQFALNDASRPATHAAVLGLIDIFYDSIIPEGNWTLNDLWR
jgi:hypothetical protein